MADKVTSWKYAEDYTLEPPVIANARARATELGAVAVTPAVGAILASYAAATRAETIVEVGSSAGVSGLWMLQGAPQATLTSIDPEITHQDAAREAFDDAGIPGRQVRQISKRASDVIDKLADDSYDLVLLQTDTDNLADNVAHATRITTPRGVIIVAHVLHADKTADPTARDSTTHAYRDLLDAVSTDEHLHVALLASGDGALVIVKA